MSIKRVDGRFVAAAPASRRHDMGTFRAAIRDMRIAK